MQMINFVVLVFTASKVEVALSQCYTNYTSAQDFINNLDKITYPLDKFEPKCVSQACPELLDLPCPYNANGTINNVHYPQILSTVQSCLSEQAAICSTPIDPIPMCPMSLTLQNLLYPSGIDGCLSFVPNTGFVTSLSQATLTYDPTTPSYIYVDIPSLKYKFQAQGSVSFEGSDQSYSVQAAPISEWLNVKLIIMVQTQPQVSVQVTSKSITADVQCGQLLTAYPGDDVLSMIQPLLNYAAQAAMQSSNIPNNLGTFIGTIIANAINAAAQNCRPKPSSG